MLSIRHKVPWFFALAQQRIAARKPGGRFLWRQIERANRHLGILDQCAPFPLDDKNAILMPLDWPRLYCKDRVRNYEQHQVTAFARAVAELGEGVTLIDCGADVGLFTRHVLARTRNVARVYAIEPDKRAHFVLTQNLLAVPIQAKAISATVSNRDGTNNGDASVLRLDSLDIWPGAPIALKIDVDGEEMSVIDGARAILGQAPSFAVQIAANVDVARRAAVDPIDIIKAVQAIRPTTLTVIDGNEGVIGSAVRLDRPFFDQYKGRLSCDVLMVAT